MLFLWTLCSAACLQADVASWRNGGNGEYPSSQPPLDWENNILWKVPLESWSNACPILVGDRLYFCQEPATLICVDSRTGETLWSRSNELMDVLNFTDEQKAQALELKNRDAEIGQEINRASNNERRLRRQSNRDPENETLKASAEAAQAEIESLVAQRQELSDDSKLGAIAYIPTHNTNGYSSFTPVSDGEKIFAAFGQGVLVAYDLDGNRLWSQRRERPNDANGDYGYGGSTSPILVDGKLIVRFSDYAAFDPETGEEIWTTPSEPVYGTSIPFKVEGQTFLFTPRGEIIRVRDGNMLYTGLVALHPKHPWSTFNSPVIENGIIYTVRGFQYETTDGHAYAFRIPQDLDTLHATGLQQIWHKIVHETRYYSSPIIHEGLLYAIAQDYTLSVFEAATGATVYEHKVEGLRGHAYPSISLAGNTLFFASDQGTLVAMQPGREYKELARSQFDPFRSTPIFEDNTVYLRTYEHLQAISDS